MNCRVEDEKMEDKVTRKLEQKKREKQLLHDVEWLMKRVPELLPQEVRAPSFRRDEIIRIL